MSPETATAAASTADKGVDGSMTPYQKVVSALRHGGFMRAGKPFCPICPPGKRRGFDVTETKTVLGKPTVLMNCFRGCDWLEITEALGLDPADLYDGGVPQEMPFKHSRFSRITNEGWKAIAPTGAKAFGIASSVGYYPSTRSPFTLLRTPGPNGNGYCTMLASPIAGSGSTSGDGSPRTWPTVAKARACSLYTGDLSSGVRTAVV